MDLAPDAPPPKPATRAAATRTLRLLTARTGEQPAAKLLAGPGAIGPGGSSSTKQPLSSQQEALLGDLVYEDLRQLAAGLLRRERSDHTLQPTALVNEAWIRLIDETAFAGGEVEGARHRFLPYAVQAMRRILIEYARKHKAEKRGAGRAKVALTEGIMPNTADPNHHDPTDQLDLDVALCELAERRPRAARIAELRIYAGASTAEAAKVVGISLAAAKQDWALSLALLTQRMRERS